VITSYTSTSTVYLAQSTAIGDCPYSDEQNYIAGGGTVYQMFCDMAPESSITILGWQQVEHFAECMETCRNAEGCNAVSYSGSGSSNCSFLTSLEDTRAMPGFTSANVTGYSVNDTDVYSVSVRSTISVDGGTMTASAEVWNHEDIHNVVR